MLKGHVFSLGVSGFWGILSYYPRTRVYARVIDAVSVRDACATLARTFAGEFRPADDDTTKWALSQFEKIPATLLLGRNF